MWKLTGFGWKSEAGGIEVVVSRDKVGKGICEQLWGMRRRFSGWLLCGVTKYIQGIPSA